jgi:hypothetical protein
VEVVPKSFEQSKAFWMVPEHDAVFIPKKTLIETLEKQWAPALDVLAVTEHLDAGKALVGEATLYGQTGWLITNDCWTAAARSYRATRSNIIKL